MAQLKEIGRIGSVSGCYAAPDRKQGLETVRCDRLDVTLDGIAGDCHAGRTRKSDSRTAKQYPRGHDIFNSRQISIASVEDLAEIAERLGIPEVKPEWIGANLLVSGIPDFTLLPPGSRLMFSLGATLVVDLENQPCKYPAEIIERHHPGHGAGFPKRAVRKRGVVAYVEYGGAITMGDQIRIFVPTQERWPHLEASLAGR